MKFLKIFAVMACVAGLMSCSSSAKKNAEPEVKTAEVLYNDGLEKLEARSYAKAVELFEELERTYPYSKWATKAQVISAYTSYKDEQYDDALVTLERFIKLHPANSDVSYAYYLRGLCFYEQISDVGRDQSYSEYAKSALNEVIARFPSSSYAQDAKIKLDLVNDHLSGKEVNVGRFYLKQGSYAAAINRFQEVIENYQTTSHVPEALHRLVEVYMAMGVRSEAKKYAAVLGYNYPGSKWYGYSYKLIEGKKYDSVDEGAKGKWYNFSSWGGSLRKLAKPKKMPTNVDQNGDSLVDKGLNIKEVGKNIEPEEEAVEKIEEESGWFGRLFGQ